MKRLVLTFWVGLLGGLAVSAAPFQDGDRVVFYGDSITHAGFYPKMVSDFYLMRYPDREVRFFNAGVAGDNAKAAQNRFDEDVKRWQPTVVTMMFGMNDSWRNLYEPTKMKDASYVAHVRQREKVCYETYTNNMTRLTERLTRDIPGVRLMFLTPSPYDETTTGTKTPSLVGTVAALGRFAAYGRSAAAAMKADCADFFGMCQALTERMQAKDPAFSFVGPDRVHPGEMGHLFLSYVFLKSQGVSAIVSDTALSAADGTVARADNAQVTAFTRLADGCAFTLHAHALPWVIQKGARPACAWAPIHEELNRERLAVSGLAKGRYTLRIDGTDVGTWTSAEWAKGIDLAQNEKTPQYRQAAEVERMNAERHQIESKTMRMLAASRWYLRLKNVNPDDFDAVRAHYDQLVGKKRSKGYFERNLLAYLEKFPSRPALEADQKARFDALLVRRKPVARRYEIRKAE